MARRTPLYEAHRRLGARIVDFAGWEMPISYAAALDEHRAVRTACGLFDVSHMGEVELHGPDALALLQELSVNDAARLGDGDGQYTTLCNPQGGVLDDFIVTRLAPDRWLLVVNASNTAADLAWIREHAGGVPVVDRSDATALLALQGPDAEIALRTLTALPLDEMRPFTVRSGRVGGVATLLSRTGYTGEDGFELMCDAGDAEALWDAVLGAVKLRGGLPCGLAARDTLRLEAGLPLHGNDMDATTTPLEAGLGWVVKLGKPHFIGRDVLARQAAEGVTRKLVGLRLDEAGVPRHGFAVWCGDRHVGAVTSGTKSPTLDAFIAMAYVAVDVARPGTAVAVDIRGRHVPAHIVERPFYRRAAREGSHAGA
jgi:aminomethyltransferase